MSLSKDSNVRDFLELFNTGKIKYQDVMDLFGVKRDLVKGRLKTLGLEYDNKAKKFLGEASEDDLNIELSELFKKQRGNSLPKVRTNVRTKEQTKQGLDNEIERSRKLLETMKQQVAVTAEGTKETMNVIRKRASFDMDVQLLKELKVKAVLHDRNVYEIVETAVRKYLKEMD